MIHFVKENDSVRDELAKSVEKLTYNTKYKLSSLQYNPQHFGNVTIELTNDRIVTRFIYDRGDIYQDRKEIGSEHWSDAQLIFSHTIMKNDLYELLLMAIENYI